MFHWICPECGGEVSPQARECAACEGPPKAAVSAAPAEPAPLQQRVSGAPAEPASALPTPVKVQGKELSPIAAQPVAARQPEWSRLLPAPEPVRAPRIAHAPLREPQAAACSSAPSAALTNAAEPVAGPASLPHLTNPSPSAPQLAERVDYTSVALSRMRVSRGQARSLSASVSEQISLPGPTLPHELTSLQAAGVAKILAAGKQQAQTRASSWGVSVVVAAAVMAGTLGATFYAMPGLANAPVPVAKAEAVESVKPELKPEPAPVKEPAHPLARVVEVTGVRFVTDLPGRSPQIHYLVVNHGNVPLLGVTVSVTLSSNDAPLTQFAFRAPRLGPYESREMVSAIQRFNREVTLPDWRTLKAEVQIVP